VKAAILKEYNGILSPQEIPAPTPKNNQVLIQLHASPINPSDLMFLRGLYGIKKKLPVSGGFEGSGTIIEIGSEVSSLKKGDRVSFVSNSSGGAWQEIISTDESNCIQLLDEVTLDQGSSLFVNPLTAYSMVARTQEIHPNHGIVQTAAASSLGKMIIRLCKSKNIPCLNIVRRKEQVEELQRLGAELILDSSDEKFDREFFKLAKKNEIQVCLEAVGGELAKKIFELMPASSTMICYGALSEQAFEVHPGMVLFGNKKIEGYWLNSWMYTSTKEEIHRVSTETQKLLGTIFETQIQKRFKIDHISEAIEFYKGHMTGGKTVIIP
jgi:NADPH:quinone reductase-like Zn-dependent oxidoreductase